MDKHLFITGGTGLVGTNLVPSLLRIFPESRVTLLLRGSDETKMLERAGSLALRIEKVFGIADASRRIRMVRGDVALPRCGLKAGEWDEIVGSATHLIHGAAMIRFDRPLPEAREVNFKGTESMLELARLCAEHGPLERFVYVGTSSVSGQRIGRVYEHQLEMGQTFFNTYEQSKAESERLVREHFDGFPCTIFRPSIIIGDSRTGSTTLFNAIYVPLRLLHRGLLRVLPARPEALLDIVPVNWVTDAIARITQMPESVGLAFHLTSGPERATKLGDLTRIAADYFDKHSPLERPRSVEFVNPEVWGRRLHEMRSRERALMSQLGMLLPYIGIDRIFDSTNTDKLLEGSDLAFPIFSDYAERILEYCLTSNWGKKCA
ncbi:MAG: SDR family oxidoreductase [Bacteroidota bacterium]